MRIEFMNTAEDFVGNRREFIKAIEITDGDDAHLTLTIKQASGGSECLKELFADIIQEVKPFRFNSIASVPYDLEEVVIDASHSKKVVHGLIKSDLLQSKSQMKFLKETAKRL